MWVPSGGGGIVQSTEHNLDTEMDKIQQSETLIIKNLNNLRGKANRTDKLIN